MSSVHIRLWFRRGEIQQIQLNNTYLWKFSAQKKKTAAANGIKIFRLIGHAGFSIDKECASPCPVLFLEVDMTSSIFLGTCVTIGHNNHLTIRSVDHFVTTRDVEVSLALNSSVS